MFLCFSRFYVLLMFVWLYFISDTLLIYSVCLINLLTYLPPFISSPYIRPWEDCCPLATLRAICYSGLSSLQFFLNLDGGRAQGSDSGAVNGRRRQEADRAENGRS